MNQPEIPKVIIALMLVAKSTRPVIKINIPKITTISEIIALYFAQTTMPVISTIMPNARENADDLSVKYPTTAIIPIAIREIPKAREMYLMHCAGKIKNSNPVTADTAMVASENFLIHLRNSIFSLP